MSRTIKRAFLVGINYRGTSSELNGCINDVNSIKDLLIRQYGYIEDNILVLTDDTPIKPTKANILKGWKWLLSASPAASFKKSKYTRLSSHESPAFFFYYSGHGSQVLDRNYDERDRKDEVLCPIDFTKVGMIADDAIRAELAAKVPSTGKLVAIIDACNSESSLDLLWTVRSNVASEFTLAKVGDYLATPGDVAMISGCQDFDTSAEITINGKPQGALTHALLSVLKEANYNITYDQLLKNVRLFLQWRQLSTQIPCLSFGRSVHISRKFTL